MNKKYSLWRVPQAVAMFSSGLLHRQDHAQGESCQTQQNGKGKNIAAVADLQVAAQGGNQGRKNQVNIHDAEIRWEEFASVKSGGEGGGAGGAAAVGKAYNAQPEDT